MSQIYEQKLSGLCLMKFKILKYKYLYNIIPILLVALLSVRIVTPVFHYHSEENTGYAERVINGHSDCPICNFLSNTPFDDIKVVCRYDFSPDFEKVMTCFEPAFVKSVFRGCLRQRPPPYPCF